MWKKAVFFLFSCFLLSCGTESGRFRFEGRFRNMNQAEFYVYSPDGAISGIDTVKVREGRFSYETDLADKGTFVIVFPNFSEQPVFGESGATVSIKGDASQMKEMIIQGTRDNEDMTKLRMELNKLSPPDIPAAVEAFIREHQESQTSIYLLQRYFILDREPNFKKAYELVQLLLKVQPESGQLIELEKQLKNLKNAQQRQMPVFTATDIKGKKVSDKDLKAKLNMVSVWASWSYQSTDMQRRLMTKKTKYGDKLNVLSICLDGRPAECKRIVDRDSIKWSTVCDGTMWKTPLLSKFGIANVPDNVLFDEKGRVVDSHLTPAKLEEKIEQILKN